MSIASKPSHTGGFLTPLTCPTLSAEPGITHGFFTRHGGVSTGVYDSLNCAYGTGDATENVTENLRRIASSLGAPKGLARAHQIHSATAIVTDHPWPSDARPQADAVVTGTPGLAVGITTADCLPILLADSKHRVIAAAHAGWKGAFTGVIEETIRTMQTLGAVTESIVATIGPAIAQGSYEISSEFYERFLQDNEANHLYFIHGARPEHWLFDLKAYAKDRLRDAGISHINILAHDTCLEENTFFSYRRTTLRSEKTYGCQMSAIALQNETGKL
jgi:YfiH family protein